MASAPTTGFRSFRSRLIVFLLVMLMPVLGGIYLFVNQNNHTYTEQTINSYLESGAGVFDFTMEQQSQTLVSILSSLTWDYGFRTAFGASDIATLFDASINVLDRSLGSVDMLMVVDMDGVVLTDTALQGYHRLKGSWADFLEQADSKRDGIGQAILSIDGMPHQLIAVPLYLPRQVAWIIGGYSLDQDMLDLVKRSTLSDVSLIRTGRTGTQVLSSTLPVNQWGALREQYEQQTIAATGPREFLLGGQYYGTLSRELSSNPESGQRLSALIHRSYQENLANEQRFQQTLAEFYLLILVVSVGAVVLLARSVADPLRRLAGLVRNIEQGDYGAPIELRSRDELGTLADAVNSMARGLAEKEKVRDLLGKVVSRQIADQLMKKPVDLEGEEKIVTIMYVDVKGFTGYCEGKNPRDVLKVLNRYLSTISSLIESNNGVVDKFLGDGVMALYGAPVSSADDVTNALHTALLIRNQWGERRAEALLGDGMEMATCIGIHTGLVVAGNLGSINRLNYSVVGDAVNLAARLESLNRYYGVSCVVSEATVEKSRGFLFRELDLVRVYGRRDPVRIYELLGEEGKVAPAVLAEARQLSEFLEHYRARRWDEAESSLQTLAGSRYSAKLYSLYQNRLNYFRENRPGSDWKGIFVFDKK